jgi:hypothetical protein
MKLLPTGPNVCEEWQGSFPEYAEVCLRGAAGIPAYAALRDHLRHCSACAADFVETLALIRWREAEAPFNRHVLSCEMALSHLVQGASIDH